MQYTPGRQGACGTRLPVGDLSDEPIHVRRDGRGLASVQYKEQGPCPYEDQSRVLERAPRSYTGHLRTAKFVCVYILQRSF